MSPTDLLDYGSVFVFALTGALAASRAQLDIVGFVFVASLTAVGGGTLRDLFLGREVFWVANPGFIGAATIAATVIFFTAIWSKAATAHSCGLTRSRWPLR